MFKYFLFNDVQYQCTCGSFKTITKIYFCRHCAKLRCSECVSHDVDSHFCHNCLEYLPSPEARLKKNKCANCFECPCCMNRLTPRAVNSHQQNSDEKSRKMYYLNCNFCRWSSRDCGLPDQANASGGWQEKENPNAPRISQLMEYYRAMAQKEKIDKETEKNKKNRAGNRQSHSNRATQRGLGTVNLYQEKYGMSPAVARRMAGYPQALCKNDVPPIILPVLTIPESTSDVEALPESYLTEPWKLESVTNMRQRLNQPQFQAEKISDLFPQHKFMYTKRSQRCIECDHNLSKPEYNPNSIKFKITMGAVYHIPVLKLKNVSKLYLEKTCRVEMVIINPTSQTGHVTFEALEELPEGISPARLPPIELVLAPKDDTAEFDDNGDAEDFKDDPNIVTFRNSNKLGFMFSLIPYTKDVWVSFKMRHEFVNMVKSISINPNEPPKEPQVLWLEHTVKIRLGTVIGENSQGSS